MYLLFNARDYKVNWHIGKTTVRLSVGIQYCGEDVPECRYLVTVNLTKMEPFCSNISARSTHTEHADTALDVLLRYAEEMKADYLLE